MVVAKLESCMDTNTTMQVTIMGINMLSSFSYSILVEALRSPAKHPTMGTVKQVLSNHHSNVKAGCTLDFMHFRNCVSLH